MSEEVLIHAVELNRIDQVRITRRSYEGRFQYHVRVWSRKEGSDEYRYTTHGVTLSTPEQALELCEGFEKLRAMLEGVRVP